MTNEIVKGKVIVKRVGWNNESDINVILLDKATREKFGIRIGAVIRAKLQDGTVKLAVVQVQFHELVNTGDNCTVSTKLANDLGTVDIGTIIEITNDVTESEYEHFMNNCRETFISHLSDAL